MRTEELVSICFAGFSLLLFCSVYVDMISILTSGNEN